MINLNYLTYIIDGDTVRTIIHNLDTAVLFIWESLMLAQIKYPQTTVIPTNILNSGKLWQGF